jgi:hypothetical protein
VTRATETTFSNYSKHLQLTSALHLTGNHEFWYCSRSRLMHYSSKIMGNNQNAWEMEKRDGEPIIHAYSGPKRTQGVASTAQTRKEATLLMLIWLEEYGLVEGSESRDFGSHWTTVIRSAGRHNDEFMEAKVTWDMHRPDLTQKTHQLSNECLWQSHFSGEESLTLTLGKDHDYFYL